MRIGKEREGCDPALFWLCECGCVRVCVRECVRARACVRVYPPVRLLTASYTSSSLPQVTAAANRRENPLSLAVVAGMCFLGREEEEEQEEEFSSPFVKCNEAASCLCSPLSRRDSSEEMV